MSRESPHEVKPGGRHGQQFRIRCKVQSRYRPQVFCLVRAWFLTSPRIPWPMQPTRARFQSDRQGVAPVIVVYKITYLNGRIYVGHDRTDSINYLGSASSALITADSSHPRAAPGLHYRAGDPLGVRHGHAAEVSAVERAMFREHCPDDPSIGYNRWPRPRLAPETR